ncbi:hypothetical protein C7I55_15910 [Sphingomonas deserti]|uniref:Uncharacterized protein n=1 Tax=Allosphingosinicella deserti TaxID=2116704 RepID=A0A2P7QLJ3_9SPHN|nr:hypothetical protein C7I55_15910 [Sphingomonas deserti]
MECNQGLLLLLRIPARNRLEIPSTYRALPLNVRRYLRLRIDGNALVAGSLAAPDTIAPRY